MAKAKDYIPRKDDDFFNFQANLMDMVVANKVAWGIPEEAVAVLIAHRTAYEPLYHKVQNKQDRTSADVLAHRQRRNLYEKDLRVFAKAYLMFNPRVSDTERIKMGLTVPDREPTPKPKITAAPIVGLRSIGGGMIEVRCRAFTDQNRPSLPPEASAVEVRFTIVDADAPPPDDLFKCPQVMTSTKARFFINLGPASPGKRFYGFFRWANLTRPENSGPFSDVKTILIS